MEDGRWRFGLVWFGFCNAKASAKWGLIDKNIF
jgi:hypothetical protein